MIGKRSKWNEPLLIGTFMQPVSNYDSKASPVKSNVLCFRTMCSRGTIFSHTLLILTRTLTSIQISLNIPKKPCFTFCGADWHFHVLSFDSSFCLLC